MSHKTAAKGIRPSNQSPYESFDQLDGQHPWLKAVPDGAVTYRVRELRQGQVVYFNYVLAKEMGLIHEGHPHQMYPGLEKKLIETFSLQIINEYDELSKRRFPEDTIKQHRYMATRYLQLQHANKQGKTSGDGRGIWNGTVSFRGTTWDVSSRGTGVTCLAPGAVEAQKPLKTGGHQFGYGCGLAEIDELLGAAIMAEALHVQGLHTERVLCVIDLGKGVGIGVRAAQNLIRPAHLFRLLKMEDHKSLKSALDYFIDRQLQNKSWVFISRGKSLYDELLERVAHVFADFTAKLDIDYIFAWLDWDGDNVLADAGIIDYGSVRQFGLRHDRYRYDDIERFSTNLNEQRAKARLIAQVFAQLVDYVKTGEKKPLRNFGKNPVLMKFNKMFAESRAQRLLYRVGFDAEQRKNILAKPGLFEDFDKIFSYFERAKISGPVQKVSDGVNHPPLFNMRTFLREMPQWLQKQESKLHPEAFFKAILSSFAESRDHRMGKKHEVKIRKLQSVYKELVQAAGGKAPPRSTLEKLQQRSMTLNTEKRITGNALINIVGFILDEKKRGMSPQNIQRVIDRLIFEHLDMPEVRLSRFYRKEFRRPLVPAEITRHIQRLVLEFKDDI
ncbi:MAG: hypothetical protein ACK5Y2_01695 [Bdellovibrionales bacterium]